MPEPHRTAAKGGSVPAGGSVASGGSVRRRKPFEYAVVRVVPRVERGERFNAGIVLHSRPHRFLGARVHLDEGLLAALAPECDPAVVRPHLAAIARIAAGDPTAGPIARLGNAERFHWLVAPSSTMVQPSEVHTGLTVDPAGELDRLFGALVMERGPAGRS